MDGPTIADETVAAGSRWFEWRAPPDAERMPVVEDAMAVVARTWSESFCALSALPGNVVFKGLQTGKVDGVAARRGEASVLAVVHAAAWDTLLALHFDFAVVSLMVEALFGGAADDLDLSDRTALSPVETRIAEVVAGMAADALTAGFANVLPTPFVLQRIQGKPDSGALGKPQAAVLIATFVLTTMDRSVEIDVIVPQTALDALGDTLTAAPQAAAAAADPRWSEQLEVEVSRAMMELRAHIDMPAMSLGDIARMRPGQTLGLQLGAGSAVMLTCAGGDLFRCDLGQSAGFYTVRIGEAATPFRRKHDRLA